MTSMTTKGFDHEIDIILFFFFTHPYSESFILPSVNASKFHKLCESGTIVRTYSIMEILVTGKFMELDHSTDMHVIIF